MQKRVPQIKKQNTGIVLKAVLTAIILAACLSGSIFAAQPEVQITGPTAVINYDPEDASSSFQTSAENGDYLQKNMEVSWHKQAKKDEDLKIYLAEIRLVNAEDKDHQNQMGFTRLQNNNSVIPKEAILVKKVGRAEYRALDKQRTVLKVDEDESKLKSLRADLADLKEERNTLNARWKNEKDVVDQIQKVKTDIEDFKLEAERAEKLLGYLSRYGYASTFHALLAFL